MFNKKSLAYRNIVILFLSILPFFIGIGLSVYQSSDTEYFSVAINVSGSQRMRTMLISNYLQTYVEAYNNKNESETVKYDDVLRKELKKYQRYYDALIFGDAELSLKNNEFSEINLALKDFEKDFDLYIENANTVIKNPENETALLFVTRNAMIVKDQFDIVTGIFQSYNDSYIREQKFMDITMIAFGAVITLIGVVLSVKIKQKEYHANHDYLTKLKNRHSLFEDVLELDILMCSMFFIDLNKFKLINDTFGHKVGDEILIEVSKRLISVFGYDRIYRYGGDEFIAVVENNESATTKRAIEKKVAEVHRALSEPIVDSLIRSHFVGLSMGIVSSDVCINDWDSLISLSDDLMYDSKSIAGNVIICSTKKELEERIKFSNMIDHMFTCGLIDLNFQPVKSICNDEICFYNITSAWGNDEINLSASEIIPILKRKGYLTEVDKNTFLKLEQMYLNELENESKNLNAVQYILNLSEDTLINYKTNKILETMSNIKMPKELIVIKVHHEMLDITVIKECMSKIKSLGYSLAVDNIVLETTLREIEKYSNIEILKIGNSLSNALIEKAETRKIMIEFINLFNKIGKKTIIEGIERDELIEVIEANCLPENNDKVMYSQRL